ncbi:hypothetical protein QKU48_gp0844 [Fadolivirus algeromassiliense]|jgi:hypothetical protein|uniref:Uncharacterized protein n=1 Tax=Fadolivirus FV1/VV64 TaxID=3070911 RepID=A0A7D3R188_9VIRU|nr:hypothetical protein QKU48_gp0844 [Fadolivirus algeromassiliense]QKF94302.1 hypothetical protein Fadolivirus_1_844 [Fadolivirus FV1/VV64]
MFAARGVVIARNTMNMKRKELSSAVNRTTVIGVGINKKGCIIDTKNKVIYCRYPDTGIRCKQCPFNNGYPAKVYLDDYFECINKKQAYAK